MKRWLATDPRIESARRRYEDWAESGGIQLEWAENEPAKARVKRFAGLLLTGGRDVNPAYYGEPPHPETRLDEGNRDELEMELIRQFVEMGRPIVGICRGIQILNVTFGGGLIQHIPDYFTGRKEAVEQHTGEGSQDVFHRVEWVAETEWTRELSGAQKVNSAHHQAIHPEKLGDNLRVVAVSPMGIIEAVEGYDLRVPIFAVQWHPERMPKARDVAPRVGILNIMRKFSD